MTHVAAATAAPHVSRRRPFGPAAWARVGAAFGVIGAIGITMLALAATILRGDHSLSEEGS